MRGCRGVSAAAGDEMGDDDGRCEMGGGRCGASAGRRRHVRCASGLANAIARGRRTLSVAAMKFLHLNFLPRSSDAGLLVLRLWFGGAMLFLHGWMKLSNYSDMASKFGDPIGLGKQTSLVLVIFAEFVCAGLIVLGLFTRVAALILGFTMGVAFWVGHGAALSGARSGELAFLFLGACVALVVAGGGKFSLDAKMGAKT